MEEERKVRNWFFFDVRVLPYVSMRRTAVAGGGGGGLVETRAGDPSHLTSKESEWKFPSAM